MPPRPKQTLNNLLQGSLHKLNLDNVLDARLEENVVKLLLADGNAIALPATKENLELYWSIKIRNRRRAFGLD